MFDAFPFGRLPCPTGRPQLDGQDNHNSQIAVKQPDTMNNSSKPIPISTIPITPVGRIWEGALSIPMV